MNPVTVQAKILKHVFVRTIAKLYLASLGPGVNSPGSNNYGSVMPILIVVLIVIVQSNSYSEGLCAIRFIIQFSCLP